MQAYAIGVIVAVNLFYLLLVLDVVSSQYHHGATVSRSQRLRGVDSDDPSRSLTKSGVGSIASWRLINATAGNRGEVLVAPLLNETVIDLADYPINQQFSIEVKTSNRTGTIGSVRFQYGSNVNFHTEKMAPWSLCENKNRNFKACPKKLFNVGITTVGATPFSRVNGTGTVGTQKKLSFRIIRTALTPTNVPTTSPTGIDSPSDIPSDVQSDVPNVVQSDVPSVVQSDVHSVVQSDVPSESTTSIPNDVPACVNCPIGSGVPNDLPTSA